MLPHLRSYSELRQLGDIYERFAYLRLDGYVAEVTFGAERELNQRFYHSREWRQAREIVIARDLGRDLGDPNFRIMASPRIHHMNPITLDDIYEGSDNLLNPEFLICTSHRTHNAIHYGDEGQLPRDFVERSPHDTSPWRQ